MRKEYGNRLDIPALGPTQQPLDSLAQGGMDLERESPNGRRGPLGFCCDAPAMTPWAPCRGEGCAAAGASCAHRTRRMHHGFTDSHMSSVSRRLTAYVEGSHMEEEVGRNLHVTYATRVALMPSRSLIPPGPPPEVPATLMWCEPGFGSARRAPAGLCSLAGLNPLGHPAKVPPVRPP